MTRRRCRRWKARRLGGKPFGAKSRTSVFIPGNRIQDIEIGFIPQVQTTTHRTVAGVQTIRIAAPS
jgi:hypothetical protein